MVKVQFLVWSNKLFREYTEFKIAAGHWPFSVQFSTMATQKFDHDCIKLHSWPIKISAWPAEPKALC